MRLGRLASLFNADEIITAVRTAALAEKEAAVSKAILSECDRLRDEVLPPLGLVFEDEKGTSSAAAAAAPAPAGAAAASGDGPASAAASGAGISTGVARAAKWRLEDPKALMVSTISEILSYCCNNTASACRRLLLIRKRRKRRRSAAKRRPSWLLRNCTSLSNSITAEAF